MSLHLQFQLSLRVGNLRGVLIDIYYAGWALSGGDASPQVSDCTNGLACSPGLSRVGFSHLESQVNTGRHAAAGMPIASCGVLSCALTKRNNASQHAPHKNTKILAIKNISGVKFCS